MKSEPLYLSSGWLNDFVKHGSGHQGNLSDLARLHRFTMSLFGPIDADQPRQAGGILFRSETIGRKPRLLIQSTIAPQTSKSIETIDATPILESLATGQLIQFRLVANPVRRDSKTKAEKPITHDQVGSWIATKLEQAIEITHVLDLRSDRQQCGPVKIATTTIDAQGKIVDPDKTEALIRSGVGRRKSHGCGLLSIVPVR